MLRPWSYAYLKVHLPPQRYSVNITCSKSFGPFCRLLHCLKIHIQDHQFAALQNVAIGSNFHLCGRERHNMESLSISITQTRQNDLMDECLSNLAYMSKVMHNRLSNSDKSFHAQFVFLERGVAAKVLCEFCRGTSLLRNLRIIFKYRIHMQMNPFRPLHILCVCVCTSDKRL